jgi:tRNA(fMet)-specific endonuclease VapC
MKYLLDTDHLSILQRQTGEDYIHLSKRMARHSPSDFATSIVTFHEQMLGSHAYINRVRSSVQVVKGYELMLRIVNDFKALPIISFDTNAAEIYSDLEIQRIQLAKMDARIAAIALSRELILLTRNSRDFGKVTGLVIEDWTVPFGKG